MADDEVSLKLVLDDGEYTAKTEKAAEVADKLTTSLKGVGDGAWEASKQLWAIGAAGAAALAGMIYNADDAQIAVAKLSATLDATGNAAGYSTEELTNMATAMSLMSTNTDEAIIGAEAILSTFTRIGQDTFPQALKVAMDLAAFWGMDLAAAARALGRILQEPGEGLEAMSRMGIRVSDEMKDMAKEMAAAGQVTEAQAMLLRQVGLAVSGQAAVALNTFSGLVKQSAIFIGEMAESMGTKLLPLLMPLAQYFNEFAKAGMLFVSEHAGLLVAITAIGTGAVVAAAGVAALGGAMLGVGASLETLVAGWGFFTLAMTTGLGTLSLLGEALLLVAPYLLAITAALVAGYEIWVNWDAIVADVSGALSNFGTDVSNTMDLLMNRFPLVASAFETTMEVMRALGEELAIVFNGIAGTISEILGTIVEVCTDIANAVGSVLSTIGSIISEWWAGVMAEHPILAKIVSMGGNIKDAIALALGVDDAVDYRGERMTDGGEYTTENTGELAVESVNPFEVGVKPRSNVEATENYIAGKPGMDINTQTKLRKEAAAADKAKSGISSSVDNSRVYEAWQTSMWTSQLQSSEKGSFEYMQAQQNLINAAVGTPTATKPTKATKGKIVNIDPNPVIYPYQEYEDQWAKTMKKGMTSTPLLASNLASSRRAKVNQNQRAGVSYPQTGAPD